MTEHEIPEVGLTDARLREEPRETTVEGWQWSGDDHDSVVVSLLGDGSVEIETVDGPGVPQHHYMRHPTPERLDPDPERLAEIRTALRYSNEGALIDHRDDVGWLLHELDKAVARDRQPYPTRQAYERTAEVLHFYRTKVQRLRAHLDGRFSHPTLNEIRRVLDGDGINPPSSENSMTALSDVSPEQSLDPTPSQHLDSGGGLFGIDLLSAATSGAQYCELSCGEPVEQGGTMCPEHADYVRYWKERTPEQRAEEHRMVERYTEERR